MLDAYRVGLLFSVAVLVQSFAASPKTRLEQT